jgi:hypothetical protein
MWAWGFLMSALACEEQSGPPAPSRHAEMTWRISHTTSVEGTTMTDRSAAGILWAAAVWSDGVEIGWSLRTKRVSRETSVLMNWAWMRYQCPCVNCGCHSCYLLPLEMVTQILGA